MVMGITAGQSDKTTRWFVAGLLLYIASFAMPAVSGAGLNKPVPGILCAVITLITVFEVPQNADDLLRIPIGLINPLVLGYLALVLIRGARVAQFRRVIGVVAMAFIPATWISFSRGGINVEIGYFAWVAGIVVMVFPGFSTRSAKQPSEGIQTLFGHGPTLG